MLSLMIIIFAVFFGLDVVIKQHVEENMNPGEKRELFGDAVIIRKVYNRGFLLNILDNHPAIVKGATMVTGIGVLVYDVFVFLGKGHLVKKLGMTLLSAGAASNSFDRLVRGKVIDYIGFRNQKKFLARITANLADFYIACGGVLLTICAVFSRK